MRQYLNIFLVTIFSISMIGAFGQEYDDLYFTKADRKKQKKKKIEMTNPSYGTTSEEQFQETSNEVEVTSFLGRQFQQANPTMEVSEESLDYYAPDKTQEDYINEQTQSAYINGTERNTNFSNPQATVYDNPDNNQPVIINNYYNDNWNNWNRPRWNVGFGFNNWGGSFWSVSYGNAWGNPWYDPFWDPWWGWNAWGPRWGWNAGWGWNSWAWNSWGWRGGFYDPYWSPYNRRPVYIVDTKSRRGRDVVRGSRATRGSVSSRESRSSSGRGTAVAADAAVNSRRSYSRQQASYLNQSRSSRYNSSTSRGSSTINSRTSNSNSSLFNSNSRSNTNSNYTRPSNTGTRSYSPPASSRSRSSSVRSSSPSRSSGSVSRSRSSSSSRSSGSRSSSGRSSSRRGGN
ncbi:hypothetical protein [Ekhidna sp.]|jgi:ABC-type cobalt transport system substrate-binding protein|uniref:hypothetical protein n=1 Tax=Ekhidna sp. TaxID=2608089 RepID=UPI0032EFAB1D